MDEDTNIEHDIRGTSGFRPDTYRRRRGTKVGGVSQAVVKFVKVEVFSRI